MALELKAVGGQGRKPRSISRPATLRQLANWFKTSHPGDWTLYWVGYLVHDVAVEREKAARGLGGGGEYPARIVGPAMLREYYAGRVTLWQKRVGPRRYRYWARREKTK